MNWLRRHGHWLLTLFVAFVFIQSLFFKFTGSPETVYIFQGKLDPWAASLGFPGVFAPGGIFSAKVVGTFELIASVLLLAGAANASELQTLTLRQSILPAQDHQGLRAEVVEVTSRRPVVATIAVDALYGGLAGLAIGGGVALLNSGNDWQRDLAIGAGAGLLIGGVFGAVDAASNADRYVPVAGESRERGFSRRLSPMSGNF